jgi:hypothetical protein
MARKPIDVGIVGNDGTGDSIRDSFRKVNNNFQELYSSLGLGERLQFIGLDDTPATYVGQNDPTTGSTPIVTVNNTESGVAFKTLAPGNGISIDFITNPNEITINADFAEISADTSPQIGGDLSMRSGGEQYRIYDAGTTLLPLSPIFKHELVNKAYADSKLSRAGVDAVDPETGTVNSAFGRMGGPLILSRDPEPDDDIVYNGLIAATKRYVDNASFGSISNLYVALSGQDDRIGVSKAIQGRALAYAYRTIEAALKRAEELVLEAPQDIGPYRKTLTYNGGVADCTLASISPAPDSGTGFTGTLSMSVDTAVIDFASPGANYYVGDILELVGGVISPGGGKATIKVLSTASTPGQILTWIIISSGSYSVLPGSNNVSVIIVDSAAPGGIASPGVGARFDITYRVNSVIITNGGTGYSLVSVRIAGGGGSGGFGAAVVTGGVITSITITDRGTGFTTLPVLSVDLPRFAIFTAGQRTDFTGDVLTNTPEAIRGRDIREGLFLKGNTSGALAQILSHQGELDSDGNELFDVDIKFGNFELDETISYGDVTKSIQICVLVESGEYYENYPLKLSQNVSIVGDEFRRVIIRPRPGTSSSPYAFVKFRRDLVIDGLTTATRLHGYHYLQDSADPVYPKINNKGSYSSAAALLELNREFIQEEIVSWMDYNILNNVAPFNTLFDYNKSLCKRDTGLLVDAFAFDLKYGDYNRTISAGLKYYESASARITITTQLSQYLAVLDHLDDIMQSVINNVVYAPVRQTTFAQIIDPAFQAESGSGTVITELIAALKDVIDGSGSVNYPKDNNEMDVFLANDAVRWQAMSAQGHGGFMGVLDPQGQILAKSPYFQECASFSRSIDSQIFAGGMFVDGFTGNLQFKHVATDVTNTFLSIENLERLPQLPASFLVDDVVFRVNYVRNYVYSPSGSTAVLVLDDTTPFTRSPGSQVCTISVGNPAVITRTDHRLQFGTTVIFTNVGGSLPTGIVSGQEYYVTEDGLSNNTFNISAAFGSTVKIVTTGATSGTTSYQRIYELLMPGNRSLLCNDFTQINDLGYGICATNGGLVESVSMFTYYCHISYYAINGAQIRSVGGSSAHGNFALVAEGSDPLEVPTPTTIFEDLAQKVRAYYPSPTYQNTLGGLFIYVYAYDYVPNGGAELEVDHGGIIYRYPVTSVAVEDSFPAGVVRLNLSAGTGAATTEGLFAIVPDGTVMTLRANGIIVLSGNLSGVAVRPSTGLKLRETGNTVYRVLQFTTLVDANGPYPVSITNASPAVFKMLATITTIASNVCTINQNHKLRLGDKFIPTSTANGFTSGTTYYVVAVPEYNQFKVSTAIGGTEVTLTNGTGLSIQGVKTHKLLENFIVSFKSSVTLPAGLISEQEYYVLPIGLTDTQFSISLTKNGNAINTTSAGSGSFTLKHEGLTKTNLRENYDFIEYTLWQPGEPALYNIVASNTTTSTNLITLSTISYQVRSGMPIVFSGTAFGNIVSGTTYYVRSSPFSANIPVATVTRAATLATIVTSVNHGLATGQVINIDTTATDLDSDNAVTITVTNATTFTYTSGASGAIGPVAAIAGRVVPDSKITIAATPGGGAFALTTASGTMTAVAGGYVPVTVSIATPAVVTATEHGFVAGEVFRWITSGSLPSGISTLANYHVLATDLTANTFKFSATPGGTPIDTSGSQSGTHSISRVSGRAGDTTWAIVAVADQVRSRVVGSKFMFKGEEYIVTQYDSEEITNQPFARLYVSRPLVDSLVAYASSYTIKGAVAIRSNGATGNLTIRIALTRVTSHDLLEIGTGGYADTNYPKEIYGASVNPINEETEVQERDVGRVFYVTTDQFGNFKVGPYFKVDQGTGTVTFSASIALSNLDGIGFKRGVPISEFSTDSAFSDNATDTVPTENATRIYIERKLGVSHDGLTKVRDELLIPGAIGGFMPLTPPSGVAMKAIMDLGNNKIVNLTDAVSAQDAVNLRSLTFANFQNTTITTPTTGQLLAFTGTGNAAINVSITGDVTSTRSGSNIDIQLNAGVVNNLEVNAAANIVQSKLLMTIASARVSAPTGTAAEKQAASGLSSFDTAQFTVTDGYVTVKNNGLPKTKIEQSASRTVVGNSTLSTADVTDVAFSTVVDAGLAIKKSQYSSLGFLRRTGVDATSDGGYAIVQGTAGSSAAVGASEIMIRDSSGDFGGRIVDVSQVKIDTQVSVDSATTATGGFIRYYGFNTQGGILIADGSLAGDKATNYWNDTHFFKTQNGVSNAPIVASSIQVTALTTGGNTTPGTITGRWTLTGTSPNESRLQATYSADLAENYEGDADYPVGTVLVFGGEFEVTTTDVKNDTRVAGVVSNTAAYTMYEACPGLKNLVALQGRVPCRVVGKIKKGDILVTSGIAGVAMAAVGDVKVGTVVGKALKDYDSDHIGTLEIAVGRT